MRTPFEIAQQVATDVLAERQRQITGEGFGLRHDDGHDVEELARAAAVYALPKRYRDLEFKLGEISGKIVSNLKVQDLWPWDQKWWKPSPENRRKELVKAGALILAEIERLDRKAEGLVK